MATDFFLMANITKRKADKLQAENRRLRTAPKKQAKALGLKLAKSAGAFLIPGLTFKVQARGRNVGRVAAVVGGIGGILLSGAAKENSPAQWVAAPLEGGGYGTVGAWGVETLGGTPALAGLFSGGA